jgi:hypothetical protein
LVPAVVVPLPAPLSVTVAPVVSEAGLSVPEIVHVWTVAVKLTAVFDVPLMVTFWLAGLNVKPVFAGAIV